MGRDLCTTMGFTHVVGDDHRKVAEQIGGFLPKFALVCPSNKDSSWEESPSRCIAGTCLVAGGGFQPPTFGL
jgi:hypothetical protein